MPERKHFTSCFASHPATRSLEARCCPRGHGDPQVAQLRCCGWQPQPWEERNTALRAFYRRLSSRAGKSKPVAATARHTPAGHELQDEPGADKYEQQIRNIVAAP